MRPKHPIELNEATDFQNVCVDIGIFPREDSRNRTWPMATFQQQQDQEMRGLHACMPTLSGKPHQGGENATRSIGPLTRNS
jgi:hypothetical protein